MTSHDVTTSMRNYYFQGQRSVYFACSLRSLQR